MKTGVVIIGAGPAGALLALLLQRQDIECVVLERRSREYVLGRIRAGVLEWGTVEVLHGAGLGDKVHGEGLAHDGVGLGWAGHAHFFIDTLKYAGKQMMTYGQTRITEILYEALDEAGVPIIDEADNVLPQDVDTPKPFVTYEKDNKPQRIDCEFVAGCDGFHGISRQVIPDSLTRTYEKSYPFAWLGIMSETRPYRDVFYAHSPRGFALASMRNPTLSRYYIQCESDARIEEWPDDRFWAELKMRLPDDVAQTIETGPSIEKSIAPLRSFVTEPMRWGNLFLAGDAAHIVPPTGAKGLNLAVSDVHYLSRALITWYQDGSSHYLDNYSDMALRRVWAAVRFSMQLTRMLHWYPDHTPFDIQIQEREMDYLVNSENAKRSFCEQYAGLPFED